MNVTVVDSDGASLGYNIMQGFEDAIPAGQESITLDSGTVYYERQSVTLKACADASKSDNNVYYELVPVVDMSRYGGYGSIFSSRGVLFTRTHANPHYRHFINSKNVEVTQSSARFEVGQTYNVRKPNEIDFVELVPDYRGRDTLYAYPYAYSSHAAVQYYYYTGGDDFTEPLWTEVPVPEVSGELTSYLYDPGDPRIPQDAPASSIRSVPRSDYTTEHFTAKWTYGGDNEYNSNGTRNTNQYKWKFDHLEFNLGRKYYIQTANPDYEIGEYVSTWKEDSDYSSVYVEKGGGGEFLDVTDFGFAALRGCTVPLYIKDKAKVKREGDTEVKWQDVYVPLERPKHSATFRYTNPLTTTMNFGVPAPGAPDIYWDDSNIRQQLMSMFTPDKTLNGYDDYVEFYENHVIPVVDQVFRDWKTGDSDYSYSTVTVFDKFWLPCMGNFAWDTIRDTVNNQNIVGIPSEGGALDLYISGIGQAKSAESVKLGRVVRNSGGSAVPWFVRTCPKYSYGSGSYTPVVVVVNEDGEFNTRNKATACYVVPHFTIA